MENEDVGNRIAPPDVLLRFAEDEEPRRVLDDYAQVIHTLREKNFTFREIAEWLQGHGFEVDHNAVWRAYAKTVPDHEALLAAEADDKLEEEELYQEAMLKGTLVPAPAGPTVELPTAAKPSADKAKKKPRSGQSAKRRKS